MQSLSDDVYHGSVEDELATECSRNKPNVLKLQRYSFRKARHCIPVKSLKQTVKINALYVGACIHVDI